MRCSSRTTRTRSSVADASAVTAVTTSRGERRVHPAAVERGTPSLVAMLVSPVSWTSWISRWS